MNLLRNIVYTVVAQILNAKNRIFHFIITTITQMTAFVSWPLAHIQVEEENEFDKMVRESAEADQKVMAAVDEWKARVKDVREARLSGKRTSLAERHELWELEKAADEAEDKMVFEMIAQVRLHLKHCKDCHRLSDTQRTAFAEVYQPSVQFTVDEEHPPLAIEDKRPSGLLAIEDKYASDTSLALVVRDSSEPLPPVAEPTPSNLLAITYEPLQDMQTNIDTSSFLELPAQDIFKRVVDDMLPCQKEKKCRGHQQSPSKHFKAVSTVKKPSQNTRQRPRWR